MKPKFWVIFILLAAAIAAGAVYYMWQPADDIGPVVVHHEIRLQSSATTTPSSSAATSTPVDTTGTSSPSGTEGWKTYTNSQYGFSFAYPPDWTYKIYTQKGSHDSVNLFPPGKAPGYEYVGDISVTYLDNAKQLSLDNYDLSLGSDSLSSNSDSHKMLSSTTFPAEEFVGVYGMISTDTYLVNKGSIIVELEDIGEMHSDDGIALAIAKSIK